jgi:Protein of unknown function (DUF2867)
MRLPDTAHSERPWRIHQIAPDFRVEDVWQLRWHGGPGDFPRLVAMIAGADPARGGSRAVRALFALRERMGGVLGWDDVTTGPTVADRLPEDLRRVPAPGFDGVPFESLYLLDDEFAAEIANRTMHGILHLGRVPDEAGGFRAQMAVLVRPNGRLGRVYMAAIKPFRHLIVYPALLRQWERSWKKRCAR